jgi:hypothetical protein
VNAIAWSLAGGVVLAAIGYANLATMAVSMDGLRYLHSGAGQPTPYPFMLRWLLPWLCGTSVRRWQWCTTAHLLMLPPLITLWMEPWIPDARLRIMGGLLVCGFSGIWRSHLCRPVLVDAPAMAWSIAAALLFQHDQWAAGILAAVVAGSIKETAPIFTACFAWNLLGLLGLLAPLVRGVTASTGEDPVGEASMLRDPLRTGRLAHMGRWLDPMAMVAPWGVAILAVFTTRPDIVLMLAVTVALAYGQLLLATGTVRLYQWAGPPVVLGAASVIPSNWAIGLLVLHQFNPWAGDGN